MVIEFEGKRYHLCDGLFSESSDVSIRDFETRDESSFRFGNVLLAGLRANNSGIRPEQPLNGYGLGETKLRYRDDSALITSISRKFSVMRSGIVVRINSPRLPMREKKNVAIRPRPTCTVQC